MKFVIVIIFLTISSVTAQSAESKKIESLSPEERIEQAGFILPKASTPVANYVTWRRSGSTLYLSGHVDCYKEKRLYGKVGADLTVEQGYDSAQRIGLCMLATIKTAVGELSQVNQVLKITGMVNSAPDFGGQPQVINGFSDLFVTAFGAAGKGARAAVGMGSLPAKLAVEISAIVELKE
ncbi:RidA family protein [Temperatibacter marinus]|uniref:RidA family protein n=1 Tax=Temperatibacter marinus TaxID=1456591 RepID=A0AA52EEH8_9PROT|nr:RidA family protein [Temperatibacter marinus]WND04007.1 RidA family protein [Temperatibacter marinus]